jgi:hypothetical protein
MSRVGEVFETWLDSFRRMRERRLTYSEHSGLP